MSLGEASIKLFYCLYGLFVNPQNATTGVSPFLLQYGIQPHGVLSLLRDNWTGFENLPKSKTVERYVSDLKETLDERICRRAC